MYSKPGSATYTLGSVNTSAVTNTQPDFFELSHTFISLTSRLTKVVKLSAPAPVRDEATSSPKSPRTGLQTLEEFIVTCGLRASQEAGTPLLTGDKSFPLLTGETPMTGHVSNEGISSSKHPTLNAASRTSLMSLGSSLAGKSMHEPIAEAYRKAGLPELTPGGSQGMCPPPFKCGGHARLGNNGLVLLLYEEHASRLQLLVTNNVDTNEYLQHTWSDSQPAVTTVHEAGMTWTYSQAH
ncbi:hypothetical protein M231_07918 [Tremella mesenterica]|uniref:Uncharacterized protein n=1 Tax=Tremella mesenterica TaxID=5217 RepID=A0A4Q1BDF5_TREME|nr:hypothetical protein M231_07918 [Tremella mesenterica]